MVAEQVVIDIIANDKASSILENVSRKLTEINNLSNNYAQKISSINQTVSQDSSKGLSNTLTQSSEAGSKSTDQLLSNVDKITNAVDGSSRKLGEYSNYSYRSFDKVNTLLASMSSEFDKMSNSIASIFGVAGFSGMIEKMWSKAAERQSNMLYLIHQKGVEEANAYYSEIMDIVTQLPGDDTFLTNILNMASALDKDIKVDNLKELGTAITDYYIASTMKGENAFEVQKDLRKYITQGDTKMMRNSILASEIDSLKNKNTVLERTVALEKALDKLGLKGMSEYESATNELEEFKGHFQKAFADIGTILISIIQPLLKFYNTLDTIFSSRISQGIILIATALVGLFSVLAGVSIMIMWITRTVQIIGELRQIMLDLRLVVNELGGAKRFLTAIIADLLGVEEAEKLVRAGNIRGIISEYIHTLKLTLAKKLNITVTGEQTISLWALMGASLNLIKVKIVDIAISIKTLITGKASVDLDLIQTATKSTHASAVLTSAQMERIEKDAKMQNNRASVIQTFNTIKSTVAIGYNTLRKWISSEANLQEAFTQAVETESKINDTIATDSNTVARITNTMSKIRGIAITVGLVAITIVKTIYTWVSTDASLSEAASHAINATMKTADAEATYGLVTATAILEAELAPLIIPLLLIVGAIIAIIVVVEKLGEAFGWWKDFGSMIEAIANGISRLWNAFWGSDVIQGIIQYFQNFVASIQYVFACVSDFFKLLFGGGEEDNGTFDIIQSIIDIFGKLGETIKWVWDFIDDMVDNNPIINLLSWLNPISILIFHLDELGSLFEDIGDAIGRFTETTEFTEMQKALSEAWEELQEPFQEIWSLIQEIMDLFNEAFNVGSDPVGRGTEERINGIVEVFKALATIIRVVVVPAIKTIATVIKIVLLPLRVTLTIIKSIIGAIQWATQSLDIFGVAWQILMTPITVVQKVLEGIGSVIKSVSDAIKNSFIGKLFGWDKEDEDDKSDENVKRKTLHQTKLTVMQSNMDSEQKQSLLNRLNEQQGLTTNNVNNVRNLGRTYNNNSTQRSVIINQNFSEGSIPVDARNMTKKEARKMFIGAFGYNRSVGSRGILR